MSKPPDISSKHSPEGDAGDVSPGWRAVFVLGIKVSAPQWQCCPACAGRAWQSQENLPSTGIILRPHLWLGERHPICIISEVKGKFHQF